MQGMGKRDRMPWRARVAMSASEFANKRGIYLGKRSSEQVARDVLAWCRAALSGQVPVMRSSAAK
jgi:hypothetical protein